jgi:hypothetical protein
VLRGGKVYTLEEYQKQQALESIIGHFDCAIEEIQKKELLEVMRAEILKITLNIKNSTHTRVKIFSLYQVAILFIYQELADAGNEAFFDNTLNTTKHKESIPALIMIACEFANAYISLNTSEQISRVNGVLIGEYQKLKEDVKDDREMASLKVALFDKNNHANMRMQLSKVSQVQDRYKDRQDYTNKIFMKVDIYTLMMLFEKYEDSALTQAYENLKSRCNITRTIVGNREKEMKYIANDYIYSQDKLFLELCNLFFINLSEKIQHHFFTRIDQAFIDASFAKIEEDIKTIKWHHRIWMKKDHWLLVKNTIQIQKELYAIEQQYTHDEMQTHKFLGNHKVFSSIAVMLQKYDKYFHTIDRLSDLLEYDFTGYFDVSAMNIKNFYENSTDAIEIEAINRLVLFWMQISRKSLLKQLNKGENQLLM